MKRTLCIAAKLQIQAAEGVKPRRFAIEAYDGGLLNVEGFDLPVVVDLAGLEVPADVPILIDHQKTVEATLGITDAFTNNGQTLALGGLVTGQSPTAQQVIAQHDAGHRWQASIGAMVVDEERIPQGTPVTVNARTFVGPIIVARKSVLGETSVLPKGAAKRTTVNLAAAAAAQSQVKGTAMSFEDYVMSLGLDAATLTPEAAAALQVAFTTSQGAAPPAPAPAQAVATAAPPAVLPTAAAGALPMDIEATRKEFRTLAAAEMRRNATIQAKASGYPHIAATAIEQGWDEHRTELEVIKAKQVDARTRPTSFGSAQATPENMPAVLEAAVCMTRKHKDHEKQFDDKTLQAAHSIFKGRIGLQQLFLIEAQRAGMPLMAGARITAGNIREVLMHCFGHPLNAAFSTLSLPGILSNVANKEILQGYMEEDTVWRELADVKSVSDFKTVTSYRLLDNMEYEELGAGGVIKHGSLGEEYYTRSVDTYAKMFSLERKTIINDDLSALDDIQARVGRGGAKKFSNLFWTTFLANALTHWTTARTNYIEGATTNLGTDGVGLGLAVKQFRKMTSPSADGSKRVGISGSPKFLLVPPELEQIADALYTARNVNAVKVSDANTFAGKYKPIIANQLSDTAFTNSSSTAFWLLGDKGMGAPAVASFLNGAETPTVENADADFNTLGVQFRGYHDFGVDMAEYLGSLRSKGAT